jgi:dephospho-CoA kinase
VTFRVVLTGGIASGKSAVANEFVSLGIPVFDTDQIYHDLIEPGMPTLARIVALFGSDILGADGRMDRRKMRERVFSNPTERKKLEAITHPAVREELIQRSAVAQGPYQIHAIPLYVEGGAKGIYDRVLVVDCSEALQISRLLRREGMDEKQARKILEAQATRDQRLAVATDVIVNNGTLTELREQVLGLHERYQNLAAAKASD